MKSLPIFLGIVLFFIACERPITKEEQDAEIAILVQEKIKETKKTYDEACERRLMEKAIPLADSLIAEMFAAPLRNADEKPVKPPKPAKPEVDIPKFPIDSIREK